MVSSYKIPTFVLLKLINKTKTPKQMENLNDKVNEILTNNGLDFTIKKLPLVAYDKVNGSFTDSPYYGLVNSKSNEVINTVKEGYTISQNKEVVEMVLMGLQPFGSELTVQKAGSLNGGRKVFIQIGIEGHSNVGHDIIKRYVTVIDSNDGSTGLSIGIGDLTMSCQNQFFKFYKKGDAKFRHTATIEQKIKTIPSLIEIALNESLRQIEVYNKFQSTEVSKNLANKLVKAILGYDKEYTSMDVLSKVSTRGINQMESLYNHIEKETNTKGLNLWGLHSGVTSWTTHDKTAPNRENGRIESAMIGTNYRTNQASLKFALNEIGLVMA